MDFSSKERGVGCTWRVGGGGFLLPLLNDLTFIGGAMSSNKLNNIYLTKQKLFINKLMS